VQAAPEPFRRQLLGALPRLRRYARSLAFDAAAADDLVQSVLERALTHWHQFDPQREVLVWLLSIAHNAHLDHLRREQRMTVMAPDQLATLQDAAAQAPGHDHGLRMDLLAALARLSPEHRAVILLVGVEQLSYAECAEVLQLPTGTVMSRLSRARVALRAALDGPAARPVPAPPNLRRVV
jgi:RNA polymerase sigma-70 factor, ECF subfamily